MGDLGGAERANGHAATFSTATGADFLRRHQRCFPFSALRGAFRRASSSSASEATSHSNAHRSSASHLRQLFANQETDQRRSLLLSVDSEDGDKSAKAASTQPHAKTSAAKSHVTFVDADAKPAAKTSKFRVSKTTAICSNAGAKSKNQQVSFVLKFNPNAAECRSGADKTPDLEGARALQADASDGAAAQTDAQLRQRHRSAPDKSEQSKAKRRHFSGNA